MTITEALQELKTLRKRIDKKREFIGAYLMRHEFHKDPLEKDGGSVKALQEAGQSIRDLEARFVLVAKSIKHVNAGTVVTVQDESRSIEDWLIWRRDVAPQRLSYFRRLLTTIHDIRKKAMEKGAIVVEGQSTNPQDVILNLDESDLNREVERLEVILSELDGMLSLKNATVEVPGI